jgi:hypothetical protein
MMSPTPNRETVDQKIGRNVVLFQQMEALLKTLLVSSNSSGFLRNVKVEYQQRVDSVDRLTMGTLTRQFSKEVLFNSEETKPEPEEWTEEDLSDAWVSTNFQVNLDTSGRQEFEKTLTTIVQMRNELIHQLLPKFDLDSTEGASEAIQYLDQQYEQIRPTFTQLTSFITNLHEAHKAIASLIASDAYKQDFE